MKEACALKKQERRNSHCCVQHFPVGHHQTRGWARKHKVQIKMKGCGNLRSGRDDQAAMHEHTGQSGGGSCKQSGRQTGVEVEGLNQIKTQCADHSGIHIFISFILSVW